MNEEVCHKTPSDTTIYKNVIDVIDDNRNISTSSEEQANTSDESLDQQAKQRIENFVNECVASHSVSRGRCEGSERARPRPRDEINRQGSGESSHHQHRTGDQGRRQSPDPDISPDQ